MAEILHIYTDILDRGPRWRQASYFRLKILDNREDQSSKGQEGE